MSKKLVRAFQASELRMEKSESGGHTVIGHAAVFNSLSEELWPGVREKIASGAFSNVLGDDTAFLWNHDPNHVLGRTKSRTLQISQDAIGLRIKAELPDTQTARDLAELMKRGDVDSMSFAFEVDPADVHNEKVDERNSVDTIIKVKRLYDVSLVLWPAYPAASASLRAFDPSPSVNSHEHSEGQPPKGDAPKPAAEQQPLRAVELERAKLDLIQIVG